MLGIAMLAVAVAVWLGPELVADLPLRDGAPPIEAGVAREARCGNVRVLHHCRFVLEAPGADGAVMRSRSALLFLAGAAPDLSYRVVADPARPGRLTTSLALARYWSRAGTFAAIEALLLFITIAGARHVIADRFRGKALIRAFREGRARPAVLILEKRHLFNWRVRVGDPKQGGERRKWLVDTKDEPIWLDPASGAILGITPDGVHFMPVDARGRFLGLDSNEAMALLASVADYQRHG
ncbi:hypothetical protein L2U69_08100 [Zavarzinia compransoris]|nr:hypothetical protein [Zavarzinia marina]